MTAERRSSPNSRPLGVLVWSCILAAILSPLGVRAADRRTELLIEGFTEPYRTVDVAAADAGIVAEMYVEEGDHVDVGAPLAILDQELHLAQLAIAQETAATKGKLQAVQAELTLRKQRLDKLEKLGLQGFAQTEEVERARTDVRLGEAELLSVNEDLLLRKLELERAKVMLDRRRITSKWSGVVVKVHKDAGEFVAANDPVLVTVAQLHPLRLVLSLPRNHAVHLQPGDSVPIRFVANDSMPPAEVERVSPLTDAESNTVAVRIRINNAEGTYRAGDRCVLDLRALAQERESSPSLTPELPGLTRQTPSLPPAPLRAAR